MICPMCGYRYRLIDARSACNRCALGKVFSSCGLARCPNCGYETPRTRRKKKKERIPSERQL